jgi:amidase
MGKAVQAFEEAGAHVEEVRVGIGRNQRELSDVWCRLIMPINLATFENFKHQGLDLLKDHRDDFPPQYLEWLDKGSKMSASDLWHDQEIRTGVYDAMQGILNKYDLLITPTLACLPVENASDGNTMGPTTINGEQVDPLIGWCLTYFVNFSGCKSFHSMGGICIILWVLFALVLFFHISLEALTKPKQGFSLQKGCACSRPPNCTDSAHGMK